jgi:hypothetical protein
LKLGHEAAVTDLGDDNEGSAASEAPAVPKKHTYVESLRVFTGRYSRAPGWKPFVRPAVMLFYQAIMWGFLVYGKHSSGFL